MIDNYLLGLFATDGSLQEYKFKNLNTYSYRIALEMKDLDIIEKIAKKLNLFVKMRKRIINNKERTFYKVELGTVLSNKYAKYLKDNKKNLLNYFVRLSKEQQNLFMLGAFDGDGGICIKKPNGFRSYICANSKDGLNAIYEYWLIKNNISYSLYYDKRGAGAYNFNIGRQKEVKKIASLLYENYEICVDRKFDIYSKNGFLFTEM